MALVITSNIPAQKNELEKATKWLNTHCINSDQGRIQHYTKIITEYDDCIANGTVPQFLKRVGVVQLIKHLVEIDYLLAIHEGLKNYHGNGLSDRLKIVLGGKPLYDSKSKSNKPRNIAFELLVASILSRGKANIDLKSITDTRAKINTFSLFIEAKQPSSLRKIDQNLKKARSQILTQIKKQLVPCLCFGIIALEITYLINEDLIFASTKNQIETHIIFNEVLSAFYAIHNNQISKYIGGKVWGVLLVINGAVMENGKPITGMNMHLIMKPGINSVQLKLLKALIPKEIHE